MKTVKISLNSIDKVKSFVNDLTKFDTDFDLVFQQIRLSTQNPSWVSFSLDLSKPIDFKYPRWRKYRKILTVLAPYIIEA